MIRVTHKTWIVATGLIVALVAWNLATRPKAETLDQHVRHLLFDMGYQPSDLDFNWSGRPYDTCRSEMRRLGETGVPCLIACLRDHDRLVRREAARCLQDLGAREAVPALIEAVGDEDGEVSVTAMKALVTLSPKLDAGPIIKALDHPAWYARWWAIDLLGSLGDRQAIEPLRRVCRNEQEMRSKAVSALRQLGAQLEERE